MAGRVVLARFVLEAIPIYFMQATSLPSKLIQNIEKLIQKFIWQGVEDKNKILWVSWEKIIVPKDQGGLGVTILSHRNKAFAIKRFCEWKVGRVKWTSLCNAKYKSLKLESRDESPPLASSLCKDIFASRNWIRNQGLCVLVYGKAIKF